VYAETNSAIVASSPLTRHFAWLTFWHKDRPHGSVRAVAVLE
jgi:hypothetical protein